MQAGMDRFVDKDLQLQAGNGMVGGDPLMRQNPAAANAMATKMYEQRLKLPLQRDSMDDSAMKQRFGENMIQLLDANHASILKSAAASGQPSGQALHVAAGGMASQVPTRNQQLPGSSPDIKPDINAMLNPRAAGSEGSLIGIPGSNQSSNNLTLKGWPSTVTENKSMSSWHHHLPVRAMSGSEDCNVHTNEPASTDAFLAAQMATLLSHLPHSTINTQKSVPTISMCIKLNENNYSLWSRLISMKVGGQGKLHHLTGVPAPPGAEELEFPQWEHDDLIVCSWLLDNMELELVNQYAEFPTAKDLWKGLYVTFNMGNDGILLFDLFVRANSIKQGTESLESIYSNLQRLWRDIELRDPNPMKCPEDIRIWNTKRAEIKLYQFLNAVSEEFDQEKRYILRQNPLLEVESAYATIRSERDRRTIMGTRRREVEISGTGIGVGFKVTPRPEVREVTLRPINASKPHQATGRGKSTRGGGGVDRKSVRCSHCGMFRHSKEECFQIIGFPEGWRSQRRECHDAGNLVSGYGIC